MKTCQTCKRVLPEEDFHKVNGNRRRNKCKSCFNKQSADSARILRKKNTSKEQAMRKQYREELQEVNSLQDVKSFLLVRRLLQKPIKRPWFWTIEDESIRDGTERSLLKRVYTVGIGILRNN